MSTIILTAGGAKPTGDVLTAGGATPPSGGSSGGSGATVTAINKTSSIITKGQKVWLNENQQTAGTSYKIEDFAVSSPAASSGVLSRGGNFAWRYNKIFSINADSATNLGSFSAAASSIRYMAEGSIFLGSSRVDDVAQYTTSYTSLLGDDFVFAGSSGDSKIYQINMADGSILNSWASTDGNTFLSSEGVKVGNYFYRLWNSAPYKCHLGDNGDIVYDGIFTFQNPYNGALYPIGVTADNRYILCSNQKQYSNSTSVSVLVILEVIDNNTIKQLTLSEAPADLQPFMVNTNASWGHKFVFNPYTGILTAVTYKSTSYVVMKYENGTWSKLPIELNLGEEPLLGSLTLSDDLTRCCIAYGSTGSWYAYIINLETTSGYSAVPYRFYNVNENTITGYAGNDTEPNGEVIVGVGSVPVVDNGGTGGGNYEPTTPPLEEAVLDENYIDLSKVASVGRVFNNAFSEPTAMDNATLTEDSGAIVYSDGSFNSEEKLVADEFVMKFHFSDRVDSGMMRQFVYLFGDTGGNASDGGNYFDGTDRSNQFNMAFGFDGEWNYKTFSVNVGGFDENGNSVPMTVTDLGNELEFGWNTIKMYFNNDIQHWCLLVNDNLEFSIPLLPKVCKPYNLNQFINNFGTGDNCVDLAETGFKLNGEWVWRAVK